MESLADKRFLFVTGKGGVGKTTACAAAAVALAQRGKRVLVAMCNAKERLSVMLGSEGITDDVKPVAPNIWAVNIDPEKALDEYGRLVLRSKTLASLLFDNKVARAFFRAVPGMQEWTMLGKAWWHTTEAWPDGSLKYDVVILDAPATGHGLDMLRVPKVIVEVAPAGLLRRDAERAFQFLQSKECGVVLVTLPEEMPTTETIELARLLEGELKMNVGRIIVNAMLPPLFSKEERASLERARSSIDASTPASAVVATGCDRATRERVQAEALTRLATELPRPTTYLPLLFEEAAQPRAIKELAHRIL